MFQQIVTMLPGEAWYGLCADHGMQFPLTQSSEYQICLDPNPTNNQSAPFLASSKGRYLYSEVGFSIEAYGGVLKLRSNKKEIILREGFATLKGAFQAAAQTHFAADGKVPPRDFFTKPQYNTWIELIYDQNEKAVLRYAQGIIENGLPAGILMIDDGWSDYYGRWDFNRRAFPHPKEMVDRLHAMGFQVMLWVCPFISPDSVEMKSLHKKGLLVREQNGKPAVREWWNGYSAVLDFTNPDAQAWFTAQLDALMEQYGIDGFKFDAGDGIYYRDDDVTFAPTDANGQTALWAKFGAKYAYNEYRACFGCQGMPLVQRLADKLHSWTNNGVAALVPNQLAQGILGYAFTCPDMVGGGEYENFTQNSNKLDAELFVRYSQCAALMPMLQLSAAPWRVLSAEYADYCKKAAALHVRFGDLIWTLAQESAHTGEPIVRYMEYEFPHQNFEAVTDQFMLGHNVLVAPVLEKGARTRTVRLPKGQWKYIDGTIYSETKVKVPAPLDVLPYFTLVV